jgi:TrpR-related protein YerC/YecD|tara:strand:- start:658 stop:969 length:312 start_codon:yes stop_codon:yes gene_type:complete
MKIERILTRKEEKLAEERFYRAIMTLNDVDEFRSFFNDIFTPAEFESIKDRWSVAELLDKGYTYREVKTMTGVSLTTIGRVARYLFDGSNGYKTALRRIKNND